MFCNVALIAVDGDDEFVSVFVAVAVGHNFLIVRTP